MEGEWIRSSDPHRRGVLPTSPPEPRDDCDLGACGDGFCAEPPPAPPPCEHDGFEPNGSAVDTTAITPPWQLPLALCGRDVDTFRIHVGPRQNLEVRPFFGDDDDVRLRVYGDGFDDLDAGDTSVAGENRVLLSGLAPDKYVVEVSGANLCPQGPLGPSLV